MIVSLKGIGIIKKPDGTKAVVHIKIPLHEGDRIETGADSFIQIEFIDQSKISIYENSDFTIKSYSYKSSNDVKYTSKIDNGLISFMSGNIGKISPQEFTIETATATIGIRGTSGEVLSFDGTVPHFPKTLEVMKKGGLGISLNLPSLSIAEEHSFTSPKTLIVTESGKGFVVKEGKVEKVTFSTSPVKKYKGRKHFGEGLHKRRFRNKGRDNDDWSLGLLNKNANSTYNPYQCKHSALNSSIIDTEIPSENTYFGHMKGISISKQNQNINLLKNITLHLEFDALDEQIFGTIKESVYNTPELTFNIISQEQSFINKDDFSSYLALTPFNKKIILGDTFPSQTFDSSGSFFNTLSGLETFSFINWGIWQIEGNKKIASGYFGGGKTLTPSIYLPLIIKKNSSATYRGESIAKIYNASNPNGFVDTGSANLIVDFVNGSISGNIDLNSGPSIEFINGYISKTQNGLPFSGSTKLNTIVKHNGFSGQFYGNSAQESSGAFHAHDNTQRITGAFGVSVK